MAPKKHMTGEDRLQIENRLKNGESISQIAKALGKSTSTVSREIQNRSLESDKGAVGRIMNRCVHKRDCQKRDICPQFPCSYPRHHEHCSLCKKCNGSLDHRFIADLVLQILAYVSEKERQSIRIRQRQGINAAKMRGK